MLNQLHPVLLWVAGGITALAVVLAGWQLASRPTGPSPVEPMAAAASSAVRLEKPGVKVIDTGVVTWEGSDATALVFATVNKARAAFVVTIRESDGRWRSTGVERAK